MRVRAKKARQARKRGTLRNGGGKKKKLRGVCVYVCALDVNRSVEDASKGRQVQRRTCCSSSHTKNDVLFEAYVLGSARADCVTSILLKSQVCYTLLSLSLSLSLSLFLCV